MDMKRKSFGRRESACASSLRVTKVTDNTKVPFQAVQQKPKAERWSSPGLMDTIRIVRGECHHAENEESLPA